MAISEIRLLPMSKKEDDFNTLDNVIRFLTQTVPDRGGKY